jgi:hypothetical protein
VLGDEGKLVRIGMEDALVLIAKRRVSGAKAVSNKKWYGFRKGVNAFPFDFAQDRLRPRGV